MSYFSKFPLMTYDMKNNGNFKNTRTKLIYATHVTYRRGNFAYRNYRYVACGYSSYRE